MNLASIVDRHDGAGRAVLDGADWLTWATLRRRARAVASALAGAGVRPGDRVALLWPNSADFVVAYLGALAAGAVAVPLNPSSPPAEIAGELAVVGPAAVVGGADARAAVEGVRAAGTVGICVDDGPAGTWRQWCGDGRDDGVDEPVGAVDRAAGDLAVLLFTSGTAGAPKAAMLTHGNLGANLAQMLAVPGGIIGADDVALAVVPMFHVFGLNVVVGLALAAGAALVPMERFDVDTTVATVAAHKVSVLVGAPPMFQALAGVDAGTDALSTVRLAVSGAAALADSVVGAFSGRYGIALDQGYGLTEASPVVSTTVGASPGPGGGPARPGSLVGHALPGVELRLVDSGGEGVLAGDPGEIWVRGDNVFTGYWDDLAASVQVLTDDRWLKTGDVGVIDADGALHVVERHKDVIIVSGFNVFPAEVERVIATVDGVEDVVVLGRPDPATGEAVEAVVVAAAGRSVSDEAVRSRCRAQLASYKCPTTVRFVDGLPRGLAGKALRRAFRDQAA